MSIPIKIVGVTGHRKLEHPEEKVKQVVEEYLTNTNPNVVVVGMALGFDMLVAEICAEKHIPFIAAIPCQGQTKFWNQTQKDRYVFLMKKAWKYKIVSPGGYQVWKMFERNKWIVEKSNMMVCYWNGKEKGGTSGCVAIAAKKDLSITNLFHQCAM